MPERHLQDRQRALGVAQAVATQALHGRQIGREADGADRLLQQGNSPPKVARVDQMDALGGEEGAQAAAARVARHLAHHHAQDLQRVVVAAAIREAFAEVGHRVGEIRPRPADLHQHRVGVGRPACLPQQAAKQGQCLGGSGPVPGGPLQHLLGGRATIRPPARTASGMTAAVPAGRSRRTVGGGAFTTRLYRLRLANGPVGGDWAQKPLLGA